MLPQRNVQSQKPDEQIPSAIAQPGLFLRECEVWEQASPTILISISPIWFILTLLLPHNVSDLFLNNPFFSLKFSLSYVLLLWESHWQKPCQKAPRNFSTFIL